MAFFSTDKFVGNVVAIVVAVIILAMVAVPIISNATTLLGEGNEQLVMILNVIPIFIVIGILLACIYMFLNKKE